MVALRKPKVLYFSGLYPVIGDQRSVPFIEKRFEIVRENVESEFIYALIPRDTLVVRAIRGRLLPNYRSEFINYLRLLKRANNPWYPVVYSNNLLINVSDLIFPGIKALKQENKVEEIIKREKPDLIHVHWTYPAGFIVRRLSKKFDIPYVLTAHGSDIHSLSKRNRHLALGALEKATKCIFVSGALKKQAEKIGYSGKNALIIPNGYDPGSFYYLNKDTAKAQLGYTKHLVGFVGNLIDVKNVQVLPELFHRIYKTNNDVSFVVIGDGPLRTQLLAEFAQLSLSVKFTGNIVQEDVARYMRAMDVLVLPSKEEGWGCVIKEAHACGTYVVGSDRGGIPEAIGLMGKTFSLGTNFVENCANHIIDVLETGYDGAQLAENALRFSWFNVVQIELDLYEAILRHK